MYCTESELLYYCNALQMDAQLGWAKRPGDDEMALLEEGESVRSWQSQRSKQSSRSLRSGGRQTKENSLDSRQHSRGDARCGLPCAAGAMVRRSCTRRAFAAHLLLLDTDRARTVRTGRAARALCAIVAPLV